MWFLSPNSYVREEAEKVVGEMRSRPGDVLRIPGHGDSWASLTLWGSGYSSEDPNGLNAPSALVKMLRVMSVVQKDAPCYKEHHQRVFLPLVIVV